MKLANIDSAAALGRLPADFVRRLWARDTSLWSSDPDVQSSIRNRLGWLSLPEDMAAVAGPLQAFAGEMRRAGFARAAVLGMGGSSLCPEVLRTTFAVPRGGLKLSVLDTTDPGLILQREKTFPKGKTLFIVSSKSGSTVEVASLFAFFFSREEKFGKGKAGDRFIAVTDPGTSLESLAREKGFRRIFTAPEDVGGRFSALTYFGLLPAALMGIAPGNLLERAAGFARACGPATPVEKNDAVLLGASLGLLAEAGRDKVTFVLSKGIASLGLWLEQLLAESTGKEGKGVVPIVGEELGRPGAYGSDRVFVSLALGGKHPEGLAALQKAGHPVVRIELTDRYDLGREFFRWEAATAAAGAVLGVNPFDEPNVAESKANTKRLLAELASAGRLPESPPLCSDRKASVWADPGLGDVSSVEGALEAHRARARPGDYVALMAYVTPSPAADQALQSFRRWWGASGSATTVGFGPRFLHSTGQLHKGGPDEGLFVQITCRDAQDAAIPGAGYGFSTLKAAQALGDFQALLGRGRRVLKLHVSDVAADLARLAKGKNARTPRR